MNYEFISRNNKDLSIETKRAFSTFNTIFEGIKVDKANYVIAGGAVKDLLSVPNKLPRDYDIFSKDLASRDYLTKQLELGKSSGEVMTLSETENAVQYLLCYLGKTYKIDVVRSRFGNAFDILKDFDFTCVAAAITAGGLVHHKDYFKDNFNKLIKLNKTPDSIIVFRRILKYIAKGYSINLELFLSLLLKMNVDVDDLGQKFDLGEEVQKSFLADRDTYRDFSKS